MKTHDFFTRIIALNEAGPNRLTSPGDEPELVFICSICEKEHNYEDDAHECCRPDVYRRYRCRICQETHRQEQEAEACCYGAVSGQPMQCPVCMKETESFAIAADCCLHTHPTMTALGRWRVAEQVSSGVPWTDAVAANACH